MLFDKNFQEEIIENAEKFLLEFLSNPGNASEKFSNILKSYWLKEGFLEKSKV